MTYHGIIPPLVTPLTTECTLDGDGLRRLLDHVLAGGVHGVFLLGSTGEGPSLPYDVRRDLVTRTAAHLARRVPLLVGVTDTSFAEMLTFSHFAENAGADALVVAPPPYFAPSQDGFVAYVRRFVADTSLPIFVYNMPGLVKLHLEPDTVSKLMDIPRVVGVKDSSGNMVYVHKLLHRIRRQRPDFLLFMGPEELTAEGVLMGAAGGVCGGANLAPRLYVSLYDAAVRGDLPEVRRLQAEVIRLGEELYTLAPGFEGYVRGLKCAMMCRGLCGDSLAEPFAPYEEARREEIRRRLAGLDV